MGLLLVAEVSPQGSGAAFSEDARHHESRVGFDSRAASGSTILTRREQYLANMMRGTL